MNHRKINSRLVRLPFKRLLTFKNLLLFISIIILNTVCSNKPDRANSKSPVVAKVGDRVITRREFRQNYETGFAHLKTGNNPKETYLNFMIREKLLALEGQRLGLDETEKVKKAEQKLRDELLIEALINKRVKSKIKVSPEEIKKEIEKSKVSFKFRYWMEPTLKRANEVAKDMRERGYAEVVDDLNRTKREQPVIDPAKLVSDYMTDLDVSPEILEAIKDVPIGKISDPVSLNGTYYIFQVLDIRRKALLETEYLSKASRFEQIIFYRKLEKRLGGYVDSLMTPKNVVTKRAAFELLLDALHSWSRLPQSEDADFLQAVENADEKSPALLKLRNNLDAAFFTYDAGRLSIADFLSHFNVNRFLKRKESGNTFRQDLQSAVALAIRDYFMAKEAADIELKDFPELQGEFNEWHDKWVYEETRDHLLHNLTVDSKDTMNAYRQALSAEVENLKKQYPVTINHAVLDTISVIEFKKSHWAHFQVFKAGTNRQAFPNVDPNWVDVTMPHAK
jgi:hypothetical protein